MAALFSLIGGIKGLAVIALIIAIGGWAFVQKNNVKKAETARVQAIAQRDQAIAQRDKAAVERDKAIEVARVNNETIARLEQEKNIINQALNTIQRAREVNRTNTVVREVIIQEQASVPANQAQAAPVLGSIIEAIQQDRQRRRPAVAVTN